MRNRGQYTERLGAFGKNLTFRRNRKELSAGPRLRAPHCSREQPQPLPRAPLLLGKSPGAADAVGRSLAFNAPAASSLLQQEQQQQQQLLRVRACGCEGECAGAGRSALPSSPPASLAPSCRSRPPAGPTPSSRPGNPESCPCHLVTAAWVRKGTILSRLPVLPGEEGSFLHFGAAANEGNLLGISPAPLVSASGAGGRDQTPPGTAHLGTRRQQRQAQHPRWELELKLGPWCSPTGSPAPLSCETGCGEGSWILVCRLLVPTQVSLLSMEEDIDTRKINNSFLRDHSYATEGAKGEPETESSGTIMKHELSR
ncbi:uncharacterized protein LOC125619143 [Marmota marmota marmota]|uniref:uncharacterized protein LOC125619143 n=1 Tax=Marmota marmota marmota TaxID=9994 RepID=UPI0020925D97|nr:uncharacterized protein LOC125619143 [Marmota marmota marmota]